MGCTNQAGSNQSGNMIADLEKAVEGTSDKTKTQELITAYQQYIAEHPNDKETNASYFYRMAGLYFRQNQYPNAADALMKVLRFYKGTAVEAASLHLLGDIYSDNLNYPELGQDLYQYTRGSFPKYKDIAVIAKKNINNSRSISERIDEVANQIYSDSSGLPNARMARKYIAACEVNAITRPGEPQAAELLFKAAMTARTTGRNPVQALDIYDWIYDQFPGYEKSYQALFLKAFTLDNDMKKFDEARVEYESFLEKYPNDEFAVSTKFLLDNLGKSDDEIIKQFEKNKQ